MALLRRADLSHDSPINIALLRRAAMLRRRGQACNLQFSSHHLALPNSSRSRSSAAVPLEIRSSLLCRIHNADSPPPRPVPAGGPNPHWSPLDPPDYYYRFLRLNKRSSLLRVAELAPIEFGHSLDCRHQRFSIQCGSLLHLRPRTSRNLAYSMLSVCDEFFRPKYPPCFAR